MSCFLRVFPIISKEFEGLAGKKIRVLLVVSWFFFFQKARDKMIRGVPLFHLEGAVVRLKGAVRTRFFLESPSSEVATKDHLSLNLA